MKKQAAVSEPFSKAQKNIYCHAILDYNFI